MVSKEQMKANQYNPLRRQLANPLNYRPYEFSRVNSGITVTNPTTKFWNVAQGPPITIDLVRLVQLNYRKIDSLQDLRR